MKKVLLIAVMFTEPVNGATSWFNIGAFSFQPGEFAKVFVILSSFWFVYVLKTLIYTIGYGNTPKEVVR